MAVGKAEFMGATSGDAYEDDTVHIPYNPAILQACV